MNGDNKVTEFHNKSVDEVLLWIEKNLLNFYVEVL